MRIEETNIENKVYNYIFDNLIKAKKNSKNCFKVVKVDKITLSAHQ